MATLGRIMVDPTGLLLDVDPAFCTTIRSTPDRLIGRNVLELTAAADRDTCVVLLGRVMADHAPLSTVKRLVRADGTHVWVHNTLHYVELADGAPACEAHVAEAVAPADWVDPPKLLRLARFLLDSRRARARAFGAALFGDAAWDIVILAYVGEAEGRVLGIADIHAAIGISLANASRWIRALHAEDLIEYEATGSTTALVASPVRLSSAGHRRLERFLSAMYRAAERGGELAEDGAGNGYA